MSRSKNQKERLGKKHDSQLTLHQFFKKVEENPNINTYGINDDSNLVKRSFKNNSDFVGSINISEYEKSMIGSLNIDADKKVIAENLFESSRSVNFSPEKTTFKKMRVSERNDVLSSRDKSNILIFQHNDFNDSLSGNRIPEKINFIKTLISPIKVNSNQIDRKKVDLSLRSPSKQNKFDSIFNSKFETNITYIKDNSLDGLFDDDWTEELNRGELDLNTFTYCIIQKCCKIDNQIRLDLKCCNKVSNTLQYAICLVKGYWFYGSYAIDDVISIKGKYDEVAKLWVVDDNFGFIVRYPDKLVSGTTVASACTCLRRAVISDICPMYGSSSPVMLIGTLMHELLQEVLSRKVTKLHDIQEIASDMVRNRRVLISLYESDTSVLYLQKEINQFTLNIYNFVNVYLADSQKINNGKKSWPGKITQICGTEENFWSPSLGIKGKVDVTVTTKLNKAPEKMMPLEVKTGRITKSTEHRGQLMLYMLMMWEQGRDVDSGLLLYLRANMLEEIKMSHQECTGLIALRNELVSYVSHNETIDTNFSLPQPVNDDFICSRCPYITLCSLNLNEEEFNLMSNTCSHLMKSSISHLSLKHIEYFFHWTKLLKMENAECVKQPYSGISSIWRVSPEERRTRGFSITAYLSDQIDKEGDKFLHCMVADDPTNETDFTQQRLNCGDFIIVSTDKQCALCFGTILQLSKSEVKLLLDKNLSDKNGMKFYIDLYQSNISVASNISNLQELLTDSSNARLLRSSIIDMNLPEFLPHLSGDSLEVGREILHNLNCSQKKAIFKVLSSNHYALIKGMPGTGKTDTIAALVQYLIKLKQTVIITSHTHSAVDNVLLKLRDKVNFLRLASPFKVHPDLRNYCEEIIFENSVINSVEDVESIYNTPVVGITCMGSIRHFLLKKKTFDYCIIDEATQVLQPMTLAPLIAAKKFVLVGDPDQLPPLVINKQASQLGLSESLFNRLDRPAVTSLLHLQYRMNEEIMRLANLFTYKGLLTCGNDTVKTATIPVVTDTAICRENEWLLKALSSDIKDSVIFINVGFSTTAEKCVIPKSNPTKYTNQDEVNVVLMIVNALKQSGSDELNVGVITPYTSQVTLLKQTFSENDISAVEVNTVDQYQGRDKEIILYSCTRSFQSTDGDILNDKRRLTVAITRAKKKFILIGNETILKSYSSFTALFPCIRSENIINLSI